MTKAERAALERADHERIKGMPISVMLTPAQISALAAAAEFVLENGGFPSDDDDDAQMMNVHLRHAFKVLIA